MLPPNRADHDEAIYQRLMTRPTCVTCGARTKGAQYCSEACYEYRPVRPAPTSTEATPDDWHRYWLSLMAEYADLTQQLDPA